MADGNWIVSDTYFEQFNCVLTNEFCWIEIVLISNIWNSLTVWL